MRLIRRGPTGQEKPAVLVDKDRYVDFLDVVRDFDEDFFRADGPALLDDVVADRIDSGATSALRGQRRGAPNGRPRQMICIGLNYSDHAAETGQPVPDQPIVFNKAPNTLVGPTDTVYIPCGSTKTDWEVELGVMVRRRCRYLADEREAAEAIAGYVGVNDVNERAFQLERRGQWVKGKSAETLNPCGPWLVTPDEVGDVGNLGLWLDINGVRRERGSTVTMLFNVAYLVHYLSQFMVLEPGDLINTGTPPGVGMGFEPPVWLLPGHVIELGIDRLRFAAVP